MRKDDSGTSGLSPAGLAQIRDSLLARVKGDDSSYHKVADELEISSGALWKFLNTDYVPTSNRIRHALGLPEMIVSFRYRDELGQFKGSEVQ